MKRICYRRKGNGLSAIWISKSLTIFIHILNVLVDSFGGQVVCWSVYVSNYTIVSMMA